ncbi:hypothetical protein V1504DRAFT_463637 [Lipomyces starkeyi]
MLPVLFGLASPRVFAGPEVNVWIPYPGYILQPEHCKTIPRLECAGSSLEHFASRCRRDCVGRNLIGSVFA